MMCRLKKCIALFIVGSLTVLITVKSYSMTAPPPPPYSPDHQSSELLLNRIHTPPPAYYGAVNANAAESASFAGNHYHGVTGFWCFYGMYISASLAFLITAIIMGPALLNTPLYKELGYCDQFNNKSHSGKRSSLSGFDEVAAVETSHYKDTVGRCPDKYELIGQVRSYPREQWPKEYDHYARNNTLLNATVAIQPKAVLSYKNLLTALCLKQENPVECVHNWAHRLNNLPAKDLIKTGQQLAFFAAFSELHQGHREENLGMSIAIFDDLLCLRGAQ